MTTIKVILIPASDTASSGAATQLGLLVAAAHGAQAVGLHVRPDPTTALPLVGEGMSGAMVEEMLGVADKQGREKSDRAKALFQQAAEQVGIGSGSVTWTDLVGREEELIARQARLADLVVMGIPHSTMDIASMLTLNAALMESGKPILLAPGGQSLGLPKRIAIAWNGSLESSRAAAAAIPLMTQADSVLILSANDASSTAIPPADLAEYLSRHGIHAETRSLKAAHNAGASLLEECRQDGIQLLVMGAYTHSRLRQLILGGVTRHVLENADFACLMCH